MKKTPYKITPNYPKYQKAATETILLMLKGYFLLSKAKRRFGNVISCHIIILVVVILPIRLDRGGIPQDPSNFFQLLYLRPASFGPLHTWDLGPQLLELLSHIALHCVVRMVPNSVFNVNVNINFSTLSAMCQTFI